MSIGGRDAGRGDPDHGSGTASDHRRFAGRQLRLQIFTLKRLIDDYPDEPLLAVLPGVTLQEFWEIVGIAETASIGVSAMVVVTALLGMGAMILSRIKRTGRHAGGHRCAGLQF